MCNIKCQKKGFTLVELLAIITILGLIALIAVPIFTKAIKDSKTQGAQDSAILYLSAVEKAVLAYNLDQRFSFTSCNVLSGGDLNCSGTRINVTVNNSSQIEGGGTIKFSNRTITEVTDLKISGKYFNKGSANGKLVMSDSPQQVIPVPTTTTIYTTSSNTVKIGGPVEYTVETGKWCGVLFGEMTTCNYVGLGFDSEPECEAAMEGFVEDPECESGGTVQTGFHEGDYVTSIDDIDGDIYIKHIVDDGVITESYVCMKYGEDTCFKGMNVLNGEDNFSYNVSKKAAIASDTTFTSIGGSCDDDKNTCRFSSGPKYITILFKSDGEVSVADINSGVECGMMNFGVSSCEEEEDD